jgi:hypothetical protein
MVAAEIQDAMMMMESMVAGGKTDPELGGQRDRQLAKIALPGYAAQLEELERMEQWLNTVEGASLHKPPR